CATFPSGLHLHCWWVSRPFCGDRVLSNGLRTLLLPPPPPLRHGASVMDFHAFFSLPRPVVWLYGRILLLHPLPPCAMCLCRLLTAADRLPLFNLGLRMASEYCCLHRHPAPCASVVCSRCC
ncbi:unnamed protein product, partial [Staurois parvus]